MAYAKPYSTRIYETRAGRQRLVRVPYSVIEPYVSHVSDSVLGEVVGRTRRSIVRYKKEGAPVDFVEAVAEWLGIAAVSLLGPEMFSRLGSSLDG